jgi:hypothetical protein
MLDAHVRRVITLVIVWTAFLSAIPFGVIWSYEQHMTRSEVTLAALDEMHERVSSSIEVFERQTVQREARYRDLLDRLVRIEAQFTRRK